MKKSLEDALIRYLNEREASEERIAKLLRIEQDRIGKIREKKKEVAKDFTEKDKQRYNITLTKGEYNTLKRVAIGNGMTISKFIKRLIGMLQKSNAEIATEKFLILCVSDRGAYAVDFITREDIAEINGGKFFIKKIPDELTGEEHSICVLEVGNKVVEGRF